MKTRRQFLRGTAATVFASCAGVYLSSCQSLVVKTSVANFGPLQPADGNGVKLPKGFTSRIVAETGKTSCEKSAYVWHGAPDGGGTFPTKDGGWIYVSNAEINYRKKGPQQGGVGALRFDAKGNVVDSYRILDNTIRNCAGGVSPWGTWLSCEEYDRGQVWECDPFGKQQAVVRPALGTFNHEAICFDFENNTAYLTEDKPDGRFYRFVSKGKQGNRLNLDEGRLQVAKVDEETKEVSWLDLSDPLAKEVPTRMQVKESTGFKGGEGIVLHDGIVSFTTKIDNRVWTYNTKSHVINVLYDAQSSKNPILTGVDNINVTPGGELIVAEDGGDLEIVGLDAKGNPYPLMQLEGHNKSEICGPAFSPDGKRLYFSSQRGTKGTSSGGITFEITGPFC